MTLLFERTGKTREVVQHRADGWPICPACEDDELAALQTAHRIMNRGATEAVTPNDIDTCYRCGPVKVVA